MDYKEEYQKALERAKKGLPIDEVFPELKESEDERIRKFLIQHISGWIGCIEHALKNSSKDIESEKELAMLKAGLAYLEKQKEQKPESCDCSRDEESYINGIHHVLLNPEAYGLIKQKPAEWSEEDNNALVLFHELISFGYTERFCDAQTAEDMRRWLNERLKSTRPQPHWKPSKVQMKALNEVANDGVLLDLFNDLLKLL